jgi:nucleoporin NUP42
MTVCQYFQLGRCKFGERCKYEHPGQVTLASGNPFGVLQQGPAESSSAFGGRWPPQGKQQEQQEKPVDKQSRFSTEDIKADLTIGRPEWMFTAYAPAKNLPRQLFGGWREKSFEEMRLRHYLAAAAGNAEMAIQEGKTMYRQALQQMDTILSDLGGAVKFIHDGENEHPNRNDIVEGRTDASNTGTSAFRQPNTIGQPSNNPFGQTSSLGGPQPTSGNPSAFVQRPAFGQPSTLRQPLAVGQSGPQGSAFGQPSMLGGQPAFGRPAFGQTAFGNTSPLGTSTFGKPSVISPFTMAKSPTAPTFGQPSTQMSAFPVAQPLPAAQTTASPFANTTQTRTNPFGQPAVAEHKTSALGPPSQISPFAQTQQGPNQVSQASPTNNPFPAIRNEQGAAVDLGVPVREAGAGPKPLIKVGDNDLNPFPNLGGHTIRDMTTKRLTTWKGQPVKYIEDWPCYLHPSDRRTYVRIFFPDGPPTTATLRDAQGKPEDYTSKVSETYEFVLKAGYFKDGTIPSVPPKTEWVSFDF